MFSLYLYYQYLLHEQPSRKPLISFPTFPLCPLTLCPSDYILKCLLLKKGLENAENQVNSTTATALGLVSLERTVPAAWGFDSKPQRWASCWPALTWDVYGLSGLGVKTGVPARVS